LWLFDRPTKKTRQLGGFFFRGSAASTVAKRSRIKSHRNPCNISRHFWIRPAHPIRPDHKIGRIKNMPSDNFQNFPIDRRLMRLYQVENKGRRGSKRNQHSDI